MGIYQKYVLPKLVHQACQCGPAQKQRAKLIPQAEGRVLEIGFGSGLNLPHYLPNRVSKIWALEPAEPMLDLARPKLAKSALEVDILAAGAQAIPLEDQSVDVVVSTYTLCTISDLQGSFAEIRRVLKPGGSFLFCEHGVSPEPRVRRVQNWLNPIWSRLGGGCQLNRDIPDLLASGGFSIESLEAMYIPGWKFASYNFLGRCRPK